MYYVETTAREFNQKSSQILAAAARGETVTVTKNGTPVARVVPISDLDIPPYPTDPMGEIDLPDLGLPELTDEEIEDTLKGMGAWSRSPSPTPTACTACSTPGSPDTRSTRRP